MNNSAMLDWENLIAQQSENNPKLKLLYEMMQQNKQMEFGGNNSKSKGQIQKMAHINRAWMLQRAGRKLSAPPVGRKRFIKYLNFFIDVNTVFSSAVGACECWGEDPNCRTCQGKGSPGFFEVNDQAFEQYVLPCMTVHRDSPIKTNDSKKEYKHVPNN